MASVIKKLIKPLLVTLSFLMTTMSYGEGTYELRGKSSANDEVRVEGMRYNYNPDVTIGLPRATIFSVDIKNASTEVIDLYTSNPNYDNTSIDIAVWCPNNTPNNPEAAYSYQSANAVFNVTNNGTGYIGSWSDVVAVQNISTRPRNPRTFTPSSYGCSDGVYTVRFFTHATSNSRSFNNGLEYMDIMVRQNTNTLKRGRVFSKHYSLIQDGFTSRLNFKMFVVEGDDYGYEYNGFVWEIDSNGIQPFSFQLVANSTGATALNQNDKSVSTSSNPTMLDEYPIYLNYPEKTVTKPSLQPNVSNFFYHNVCLDDNDSNGYTKGGYFNFYSSGDWKYKLYIDVNKDGEVTLDEKLIQGRATAGLNRIYWDGVLPNGNTVSNNTKLNFNLYLSDGEVHFPWVDVENRYSEVGPIITLKSATTTDSVNYYWDDSQLNGGTTALMDGTSLVRTWGNNIGDGSLMDTWKYAYNSGLKKSVIYGGECAVPDLGGNVSGFVFDDKNHNGAKDSGESGISNVTIVLHNKTNNDCETQKTDSKGYFLFDNILMSEFDLVESANETLPISYKCPPDEEDPLGYISVDSNTKKVVFNELNASYLTFANYKGYRVSGNTFIDNGLGSNLANNGIKESTEALLPKIKIEAKEGATTFESIISNGDGFFEFWVPSSKPTISINAVPNSAYINSSSSVGNSSGTKTGFNQITLNGVNQTYSGLLFGHIKSPSLTLAQTQTIQAGSTAFYSHQYKVNSIGSVSFSITETVNTPYTNNSNSLIYEDKNCNGVINSTVDKIINAPINVNVNVNNKICVIVKVITQNSAPNNSTYSYSLNAQTVFMNLSIGSLKTVKDLVTITDSSNNSNLSLLKSVNKTDAKPNEIITYNVKITNNGQDFIDNIKVDDYTPNFTNFVSAECPSILTSSIINCTISKSPVVGGKGSVQWLFNGKLLSGENMTIIYKVRVDN